MNIAFILLRSIISCNERPVRQCERVDDKFVHVHMWNVLLPGAQWTSYGEVRRLSRPKYTDPRLDPCGEVNRCANRRAYRGLQVPRAYRYRGAAL